MLFYKIQKIVGSFGDAIFPPTDGSGIGGWEQNNKKTAIGRMLPGIKDSIYKF